MKEANPSLSITELSKLLGQKWKELDEDERTPYLEAAAADRERYVAAKAAYERGKAKPGRVRIELEVEAAEPLAAQESALDRRIREQEALLAELSDDHSFPELRFSPPRESAPAKAPTPPKPRISLAEQLARGDFD